MKRNILRKLLFIPLLAILITGCTQWLDRVVFKPLPTEHYPSYVMGDTFMYKSILTNDVDTFVVTDYVFDTLFDGATAFESTVTVFDQIIEDDLSGNVFILLNEPKGVIFRWDTAYIEFINISDVLDTTMQGFDYNDLFVARSIRHDTISNILHKVYIDWNYGLVKYTYNSLDTYELFYRPE